MADTIRTNSQLIAEFPTNNVGDITAQDARDLIVSVFGHAAARDPNANDDNANTGLTGAYFDKGSEWQNTTDGTCFMCLSGSVGAAIWVQTVSPSCQKNTTGTRFGPRKSHNFIEGTNVAITVADNPGNSSVDITIGATFAGITGGGTTGTLPKFAGSSALGDSALSQTGTGVGSVVSAAGDIQAAGGMQAAGPVIFSSTLEVSGATDLDGALDVASVTTLNSTLSVSGATTLSSTLNVTGMMICSSLVEILGSLDVDSDLDVSGPVVFNSTLNVSGATTLSSTLAASGATTLSSTLNVSGATTLSSTLNVSGATTLSSTLTVSSTSHLVGDVTMDGSLAIGVNLTVTGTITATNINGWVKVVINYTDLQIVATSKTVTLRAMGAGGTMYRWKAYIGTAFTGVAAFQLTVGYSGGQYAPAASTNTYGTIVNPGTAAQRPQFGTASLPACEGQTASWNVTLTASGAANLSGLTAGQITFWLDVETTA